MKISLAQIDHHNKHIFKKIQLHKKTSQIHIPQKIEKGHIFIQGFLMLFHAQYVKEKKNYYANNNSNKMQQHNITNEMHYSYVIKNIHVHVMIKLFKHTIDSNIDNINYIDIERT